MVVVAIFALLEQVRASASCARRAHFSSGRLHDARESDRELFSGRYIDAPIPLGTGGAGEAGHRSALSSIGSLRGTQGQVRACCEPALAARAIARPAGAFLPRFARPAGAVVEPRAFRITLQTAGRSRRGRPTRGKRRGKPQQEP